MKIRERHTYIVSETVFNMLEKIVSPDMTDTDRIAVRGILTPYRMTNDDYLRWKKDIPSTGTDMLVFEGDLVAKDHR